MWVRLEHKVSQFKQDLGDLLVLEETLAIMEVQDHKVHLEEREIMDKLVEMVLLE